MLTFPLWVSLGPVVAGRGLRSRGRRGLVLGTAGSAALGLGFGLWAFLARHAGVSSGQALVGAAEVAGLLVLLPAALYLQLGYRVRSWALTGAIWFASLLPLVLYLLVVSLGAQQDIECPTGESCSPFS